MIANTFTTCRVGSSLNPFPFLLLVLTFCCYCSLANILMPLDLSSSMLALTETIRTTNSNDQYPVTDTTTSTINLPAITNTQSTIPTTTAAAATINKSTTSKSNTYSYQYQPKSLKFTLIAGKHWRFNIKANSFSSTHNGGELRLHKNVSLNNYIIDDDGWFQYNPQQQQLFAWPNLFVQPGTYYFVLLPSGTDFEADSENAVKNLDVVANIIVELIRPLRKTSNDHIDRNIDHKFSLEFLHRHQTYPLLLQQIVSVFDTITRPNNNPSSSSSSYASTTTSPTTTTITNSNNIATTNISTSAALLAQQKNLKLANKLSEYLLISSTYSSDGEFFSLTWSVHPSLVNNSITSINECRLATINETVSKLSTLTSGYQSSYEKYVIYYPLDAPLVNSNAIVPTERGNNSLKLYLNGPCQKEKIIQELVSAAAVVVSPRSVTVPSISSTDIDDKEDNIVSDLTQTQTQTQTTTTIPTTFDVVNSVTDNPSGLPSLKAIDSSTALQDTTSINPTTISPPPSPSPLPESSPPSLFSQFPPLESSPQPLDTTTIATPVIVLAPETEPSQPPLISEAPQTFTQPDSTETIANKEVSSSLEEINPNNTVLEAQIVKSEVTPLLVMQPQLQQQGQQQQQQPTKMPPQAKSFADFLDSNDVQTQPNITMSSMISTTEAPHIAANNLSNVVTPLSSINNSDVVTAAAANVTSANSSLIETSLNEDLIGILDDVMSYLIKYAVPASVIVGLILLLSIFIALCKLCLKKRKSKQFQVRNRFDFRYGSERRGFLKTSSKPVILDADQKSLSIGGTPQHRPGKNNNVKTKKQNSQSQKSQADYLPMHAFSSTGYSGDVGKINGDATEGNHS